MMGLCIMAFCRSSVLQYINNLDKDEVKTGFGGNMGNKGSVIIRFDMHLTPIIIWWSHLESGQSNSESRVDDILDCTTKAFVAKK